MGFAASGWQAVGNAIIVVVYNDWLKRWLAKLNLTLHAGSGDFQFMDFYKLRRRPAVSQTSFAVDLRTDIIPSQITTVPSSLTTPCYRPPRWTAEWKTRIANAESCAAQSTVTPAVRHASRNSASSVAIGRSRRNASSR